MEQSSDYWRDAFSRRLSRRGLIRAGAVGGAGLAGLYALGCQQGQPRSEAPAVQTQEPKRGGILRIDLGGDPPHLDSMQSATNYTYQVNIKCYNRLLKPDGGPGKPYASSKLVGDLAEKWEMPDDSTYVFSLRKGVKFHDVPPVNGRELVASDVKYTFERLKDKATASPHAGLFVMLEKVDAPDNYTVRMKTSGPYAPMLNYLAHVYAGYIVAREVVEKFGDLKQNVIGTGPFVFQSWERKTNVVYRRHPDYFVKGLPYVDGLEMLIIIDQAARTSAFRSGQTALTAPLYPELESIKIAIPGVRIEKNFNQMQQVLSMHNQKPPFNDKRVRQAVKYACDIQKIIDLVYFSEAVWSPGIPPVFEDWALSQEETKQLWKRDVAKAKQLMVEAGYPDGFKTTLLTSGSGVQYTDMAELTKEWLKEIKIDVTIDVREYGAWRQKAWLDGTYEMSVGPKSATNEADEWLHAGYHTKGDRNWSRGSDPAYDALAEKQRKMLNETERTKVIKDMQRMLADLAFDIPFVLPYAYQAVQPYLKDYYGVLEGIGTTLPYVWLDK